MLTPLQQNDDCYFKLSLLSQKISLHYAKSYRPFELFVNENYKL